MPAPPEEIEQALEEGIKLLPSWGPQRVLITEGDVAGLELVRCTSVFDAEGRFDPSFDPATTLSVDADCVLLAIGQEPDLRFAGASLPTDGTRIAVTEQGASAVPGLFAGGDAVTGPASVVEAVAAGRRAATAIDTYLGGTARVSGHDEEATPSSLIKIRASALSPVPRAPAIGTPPSGRDIATEDMATLDLSAVVRESNRCLDCACVAVNASDLAPALVALGARIKTTRRMIDAERFFAVGVLRTTVLDRDELVTEIEVPLPRATSIQGFRKFRIRQSIDFPIVNVASILSLHEGKFQEATVVLGAVAPVPLRAAEVERFLVGRQPDAQSAEAAGEIAVRTACPLRNNAFKAQIVRALLREAVLQAAPVLVS
jgi:CO/xanthine dehydrogenase FAD-binding subunit